MDGVGERTSAEGRTEAAGRPAAGEDPVKREQILDGAHRVFMTMGFDAASMNDITREAGVSKGTLYVYFKNKEELFVAIIERQKLRIFGQLQEILDRKQPVDATLHDFGVLFATHLLSDKTIRAMRNIIGVIDRMPSLSNLFMATGPKSAPAMLVNYLEQQVENGNLKDIEDPLLTGRQFADLCLAGLFRPRLFGELTEAPSAERIEKNVASAIRLFMNTYGATR
jgi:AcrR family transcriptional regulator